MAANFDFELDQGTDFDYELTIKDKDDNPIDLTGYTFRSQARESLNGDVMFQFAFVINPDQVTNKGKVNMTLSNAASSAIPGEGTKFIYDVEQVNTSGKVARVMQGKITLSREVTR